MHLQPNVFVDFTWQAFSFTFLLSCAGKFTRQQASPLACLGFACSNFAKKNKRLLAVYNIIAVGSIQFFLERSLDNKGYMSVSVTWSSTIWPSSGSSSKQFSTITINTPTVTSWRMTLPFLKSSIVIAAWNKTTQWWEKKWFLKPFLAGRQTWIQRKKISTLIRKSEFATVHVENMSSNLSHMCRIKKLWVLYMIEFRR